MYIHIISHDFVSQSKSPQALKEEGTTAVSAVFLAPPDAAPAPAAAPKVEEAKPKAMEAWDEMVVSMGKWGKPKKTDGLYHYNDYYTTFNKHRPRK